MEVGSGEALCGGEMGEWNMVAMGGIGAAVVVTGAETDDMVACNEVLKAGVVVAYESASGIQEISLSSKSGGAFRWSVNDGG